MVLLVILIAIIVATVTTNRGSLYICSLTVNSSQPGCSFGVLWMLKLTRASHES